MELLKERKRLACLERYWILFALNFFNCVELLNINVLIVDKNERILNGYRFILFLSLLYLLLLVIIFMNNKIGILLLSVILILVSNRVSGKLTHMMRF